MAFTFHTDILISEYLNSEFHASIFFCLPPASFPALLVACGSSFRRPNLFFALPCVLWLEALF